MKTAIVGVVVMADLFPEIRYMMVKKIVKTDLTNFMKKKCFQVTKRKLMGRDRANLKARSVVNGIHMRAAGVVNARLGKPPSLDRIVSDTTVLKSCDSRYIA